MEKIDDRAAYCGLFCGACPLYVATRTDGGIRTEEGELLACDGCRSAARMGKWCATCTLKTCARGKGLEFCNECAEYPCGPYVEFRDAGDYPYHTECPGYLEAIRAEGWRAWIASMEKKWTCPSCAKPVAWWDRSCQACGADAPGFEKPAAR